MGYQMQSVLCISVDRTQTTNNQKQAERRCLDERQQQINLSGERISLDCISKSELSCFSTIPEFSFSEQEKKESLCIQRINPLEEINYIYMIINILSIFSMILTV